MAANTVLNYLPRKSVIHRLTGTTKLAFFLLFTFASMITYNTWVLLGLLAVSIAAFRLSKIKIREVRFMMIFMLVFPGTRCKKVRAGTYQYCVHGSESAENGE